MQYNSVMPTTGTTSFGSQVAPAIAGNPASSPAVPDNGGTQTANAGGGGAGGSGGSSALIVASSVTIDEGDMTSDALALSTTPGPKQGSISTLDKKKDPTQRCVFIIFE